MTTQMTLTGERADPEARHRARVARFEAWRRETLRIWREKGLIP